MKKLLVVIPTYGKFDYAAVAADSLAKNTPDTFVHIALLDDASPEVSTYNPLQYPPQLEAVVREHTGPNISWSWARFPENGGLTRSWNHGLRLLLHAQCDYACVTNSDVYFPLNWHRGLFDGLEKYALVGPVTNAPGTEDSQYVGRYSLLYVKRDQSFDRINLCQQELLRNQAGRCTPGQINGFCMMAKASTWLETMYDQENFFCPRNDFNSKGQPNPTPLMTLNEYEFQRRLTAKGLAAAVCLSSYVFHYRAVSRGDAYKRGDWCRLEKT